jgi:putative component of membrane protein insertase Oxa1/YidC/SpoIIIJ protein YidD
VKIHGAVYGTYLAVRRLLRCHPWNPGGVDLVPPKRDYPWWRLRRRSAATVPDSRTTPQGV